MAALLQILTILCVIEMKAASNISEIKSHDSDIEKNSESVWSQIGSIFDSLKTYFEALPQKMDSLTEKMEAQTLKVDALTHKFDRALDRKECPSGFNYLPEVDQCLRLNTDKMNWSQAQEACRSMKQGGHMVTITSSAKQEAVKRYLEKQFAKPENEFCVMSQWPVAGKLAWINGQRQIPNRCDTPFVWKYKQGVEVPFNFTKWHRRQPDCNGNNEQCAHIASALDYDWNDIPCTWPMCSVCEV